MMENFSSSEKFIIRTVMLSDAKFLLPLIAQLGYAIPEESLIARIALYQLGLNDIAWVVTTQEGGIIGCIAVHLYDLFHCNERYARIVSIAVKEEYRRQGVGNLLIKHAEKYAQKKHCIALELTSSLKREKMGVHSFYENLGYHNEGEYKTAYFRKFLKPKTGPQL